MFEHFPYTNMHELNLDWIIEKVKEAYSPENPPENMVLSVNGQTGNVTLYTDAIVKFPTVESDSWNIYRILTGNRAAGIEFAADGTAKIINGVQRNTVYTSANPPEFPVLSVNGQTGSVVLYAAQNVKFPDITETSWNLYRTADGQNLGIKFEKDTALYRINGLNRVLVYDAENQPPYPVTSVNGRTGAVSVQEPFVSTTPAILQVTPDIAGTYWGVKRDTTNGEAGIYFEAVNDTVAAYLTYKPDGGTEETIRLLTLDDIPSSSGVISVNGKTGVVTLYGNEIYVSSEVGQTLEEALTDLEEANDTQDTNITQLQTDLAAETTRAQTAETNLQTNLAAETTRAQTAEANIENGIAIIVMGDTAASAIPAGNYAYIKNNTHGLTEGLYTATAAFPATGGTADSTAFSPVNAGGMNDLKSNIDSVSNEFTTFKHTAILLNSNLNNLTIPGFYSASSGSVAASLANCPYSSAGFSMIVMQRGSQLTQTIITAHTLYTRILASGGWGAWYQYEGTAVS